MDPDTPVEGGAMAVRTIRLLALHSLSPESGGFEPQIFPLQTASISSQDLEDICKAFGGLLVSSCCCFMASTSRPHPHQPSLAPPSTPNPFPILTLSPVASAPPCSVLDWSSLLSPPQLSLGSEWPYLGCWTQAYLLNRMEFQAHWEGQG